MRRELSISLYYIWLVDKHMKKEILNAIIIVLDGKPIVQQRVRGLIRFGEMYISEENPFSRRESE